MISTLKHILRPYKRLFVPEKQIEEIYYKFSYSQEGEDMILARLFEDKREGFYIDVGAHHPQRFSNTYYFYLLGWKGINIDAMPNSMELFHKIRPNDINLEIAISDLRQKLTYYTFNEPALNSFCKDLADTYQELNYELAFTKEIQTYTLSEVLDEYLPLNQTIDFLSIDVEGLDYQVLNSNNWEKYRPTVLLVEDLQQASIDGVNQSKVACFLRQQNYVLSCKTANTSIFLKTS